MRVFLSIFIGDMFVRSLLSLTPFDTQWNYELSVEVYPKSLPTPAELDQIASGKHSDTQLTRTARLSESLASLGPFSSPIPSEQTREKLNSAADIGKYAAVWITSRLRFIGSLAGVDQCWPMFSPSVSQDETRARIRLVFADGSTEIWYSAADPADITWYSHWFAEKPIQAALKVYGDVDSRIGYCNWLSHQVTHNGAGSPLQRIEVFEIHYDYPPPGENAVAFIKTESRRPQNHKKPFWVYDVATRSGKRVE